MGTAASQVARIADAVPDPDVAAWNLIQGLSQDVFRPQVAPVGQVLGDGDLTVPGLQGGF